MTENRSISKNKRTKLLIVPWYNKKEWLQTYHQAYSDNVELQEKSYTQMCIWKARYPNLPLGVECTMSMLHVRLCDRQAKGEESSPTFKDRDLQLLYSTAVMRFLNHLSVISTCKDSMYKMAEQQNIPDWLINLRHEAAHGNSLPALYMLRQASDIIMQWLKTQYWEIEADIMEDFIIDRTIEREKEDENIQSLLDLWLILKISHWSGLKTIDNISDVEVRERAMELAEEKGFGIKITTNSPKKKNTKRLKKHDQTDESGDVIVEKSENPGEYTHKIKTAFEPLLKKMLLPIKGKKCKDNNWYQEHLIKSLVHHQGFCPNIQLDKLSEAAVLELMSLLGDLWKEIIEALQAHSLLPLLLATLMAEEAPCAQLWLRLLTHLLSGEVPHQPRGSQAMCELLAQCLPCQVDPQVLMRKADFHFVDHNRRFDLKRASAREVDVLQDLAQQVLANPTKFTLKYLNSLLNFWETPLSTDTKDQLCSLAGLYIGHKTPRTRDDKVYTLASLLDHGLVIDSSDMAVAEKVHDHDDSSPWKLYTGDADWGQCALGTLPWL